MSSSDENLNPETDKFVQAVLAAFARLHFAAVPILPSDDIADSKATLAQMCELESLNDPKRRPH
jgi:hypothetical protein